MLAFKYHKATLDDIAQLGSKFCDENGDSPDGAIPDAEYDRLFDHLAVVLSTHGTFIEGSGDADFKGYRYVDQIPWISILPGEISPSIALSAALEAAVSSHRPCAYSFDFSSDGLMILPPNRVYTTFEERALAPT